MRYWMICYDISDNRQRKQVAEALANAGAIRVQESVFEGWFEKQSIYRLVDEILNLIDADGDTVRVYPLKAGTTSRQGLGQMPERIPTIGVWLC